MPFLDEDVLPATLPTEAPAKEGEKIFPRELAEKYLPRRIQKALNLDKPVSRPGGGWLDEPMPTDPLSAEMIQRTQAQFGVTPRVTEEEKAVQANLSNAGNAYFHLQRKQGAVMEYLQSLQGPTPLPRLGTQVPTTEHPLSLEPAQSEDYLTSKFGPGLKPGEVAKSSEELDMQRMRLREDLGLPSEAPDAPAPMSLFGPIIPLGRAKADKSDSVAEQIGKGLVNVLAQNAETIESPGVLLSMLGGAAVPAFGRVLGGVFAADMGLRAMPQYAKELRSAIDKGDAQAITEAAGNWLATGLFAMGGASAALDIRGANARIKARTDAAREAAIAQVAKEQFTAADKAWLDEAFRTIAEREASIEARAKLAKTEAERQAIAADKAQLDEAYKIIAERESSIAGRAKAGQLAETEAERKALAVLNAKADELATTEKTIEASPEAKLAEDARTRAIASDKPHQLREIVDEKAAIADRARLVFEETAQQVENSPGGVMDQNKIPDFINQLWKAREATLRDLAQAVEDLNRSLEVRPPEFSTPEEPGWIAGTSLEKWADEQLSVDPRSRTRIGLDPAEEARRLTAWTIKGVALLERGLKTYPGWAKAMIKTHGDEIKPHLQTIYDDSRRVIELMNKGLAGKPMRKLSARAVRSQNFPPELQAKIATSPESFLTKQNIKTVADAMSQLSEGDLAAVPFATTEGPENAWVAARAEMINRLLKDNKGEAAWSVFSEMAQKGTTMGQLLNQMKLIPGVSERAMINLMNKRLAAGGYDAMKPAEDVAFRATASKSILDQNEFRARERAWQEQPSDENFNALEAADERAKKSAMDFQELIWKYEPRTGNESFRSMMQGTILVVKSIAANVGAMAINAGPRQLARTTQTGLDMLESMLGMEGRTSSVSPIKGTVNFWKAAALSWREMAEIAITGRSSDRPFPHRPLRPYETGKNLVKSLVSNTGDLPTKKGGRSVKQNVLAFFEAQPSAYLGAALLRALGVTDTPFYRGAKARIITNALKTRWINMAKDPANAAQIAFERKHEAKFLKYPELVFGKEAMTNIELGSATDVYQNPNKATRFVSAIEQWNPAAKAVMIFLAPYRATPSNVFAELASWKPVVAEAKMVEHIIRGNRSQANLYAAKSLIGGAMTFAGVWLYNRGLISPLMDDPSEQNKNRALGYRTMPAGHINISGLGRVLGALREGKDTSGLGRWRENDETRDMVRSGGVVGAALLDVANWNRWREKQPKDKNDVDMLVGGSMNAVLSQADYMINQTYLKGSATALDAILQRKENDWLQSAWEQASSLVLPQSLNTWTRASRDYVKEIRNDDMDKRLGNVIRQRLGALSGVVGERTDASLPNKIDLWGQPVAQTPPGANPWLFHLLDVTGKRNIPADPVSLMIYDTWRKTQDARVVPTPPDQNFSYAGKDYHLDRAQLAELQTLVGQNRKKYLDSLTRGSREFMNKNARGKIEEIQSMYALGAEVGNMQFYLKNGKRLTLKAEPRGFVPK